MRHMERITGPPPTWHLRDVRIGDYSRLQRIQTGGCYKARTVSDTYIVFLFILRFKFDLGGAHGNRCGGL